MTETQEEPKRESMLEIVASMVRQATENGGGIDVVSVGPLFRAQMQEDVVHYSLIALVPDRTPRQRSPTTHARSWTASTWSASVRYSLSRRRLASNTASL